MTKKIVSLLMCLTLLLSFNTIAFAAEDEAPDQVTITIEPEYDFEENSGPGEAMIPENPLLRGGKKPGASKVHNLKDGKYEFNFECLFGRACYSAKNFKGASTMELRVHAGASKDQDYTVKLYKRGTISDDCVATYTRNTGTDEKTFMKIKGLSTTSKYYFKIVGKDTISGSGSVKKG